MTKYQSADVGFLLMGAVDLVSISSNLEYGVSDPLKETTPFGVSAAAFSKPGVKTYAITGHDGWYDDTQYTAASAMVALAAAQNVFMFAHKGNTAGLTAICAGGVLSAGLGIPFAVGDFHHAKMELGVSGVIDHATLVAALVQVTSDGTTESTYVDLGATGGGTTGANVYMACTQLALTGSTNLIVTLEDSADHGAWATHTAMTALTAVGAEMKVATDMTVNRYLAAKRAFTGLAGTPTATFVLAAKVNSPH